MRVCVLGRQGLDELDVTNTSIPRFQQTLYMCNGRYATCLPSKHNIQDKSSKIWDTSNLCQVFLHACVVTYLHSHVHAYVILYLPTSTTILTHTCVHASGQLEYGAQYKWSFNSQNNIRSNQCTTISANAGN